MEINFLKGNREDFQSLGVKNPDSIYITKDYLEGFLGEDELWGPTRFLTRADDLTNITNVIESGDSSTLEAAKDYANQVANSIYMVSIEVNPASTVDYENGSVFAPFKTIQAAIESTGAGFTTIEIAPGMYHENILIQNKKDIVLRSAKCLINGTLTFDNVQRSRMENISILGVTTHKSSQVFNTTNCNFGAFNIESTSSGNISFYKGNFSGNFSIYGSTNVDISNCIMGANTLITQDGNSTVILSNVSDVTYLHNKGHLKSIGSTNFKTTTTNPFGIKSTAIADNDDISSLQLISGTCIDPLSGVVAPIIKEGDCKYSFGTFIHEPIIDSINPTSQRINIGLHDADIYSHYSPVNYAKENDLLNSHIKGIDNALGLEANTRQGEVSELRSEIDAIAGNIVSFGTINKSEPELLAMAQTDRDTYITNFVLSQDVSSLKSNYAVYTNEVETSSYEWVWNSEIGHWVDNGAFIGGTIATISKIGLVKASTTVGEVNVNSSGIMNVSGWSTKVDQTQLTQEIADRTDGDTTTLNASKVYTETYVTNTIGNINNILDSINGEVV